MQFKYNIFKNKTKWTKPNINEQIIVDFLNGVYEKDIYGSELLGIRSIEVSRNHNNVDIIFCKAFQQDTPRITEKNALKPFLWAKQFKTSTFFRYNIIVVPEKKVSNGKVLLPNGEIRTIDGSDVRILEQNDDGSYNVMYKIKDIDEWKRVVNKKQKLYGISIEEQLTSFDNNIVNRIDRGFKYKISIKNQSGNPNFSDNPYFQKKITGSYNNLVDFFKESGLSMRGKVYLDDFKFKEFFNYISQDLNSKILFFLNIYKHRNFFNPFKKDCVDFNKIINFYKNKYPGIAFKINKSYINDLIDQKLPEVYETLIDSQLDLESIFKVELSQRKLNDYIIDCFTFDDNLDKKDLYYYIKDFDFTYEIESQIYSLNPLEQYMIQTGRRLFKGIENYEDLNVLILDIETTAQPGNEEIDIAALKPELGRIFQIGIKTTEGFVKILEADNDKEEIDIITESYKIISDLDPDLVLTFNGEGFDFPFMEKRLELLGCVADENSRGDDKPKKTSLAYIRNIMAEGYERYGNVYPFFVYRKVENSVVKIGGTTERYTQTKMFGKNICDVMFAVKRAAEQDKSLPNSKLKDNIKHANLAKKNRVYVQGDLIGKIAADKRPYYFNDNDGSYFVSEKGIIKENLFNPKNVYEGEEGFYYGNLNRLYIKGSNEYKDLPILDKCTNVFTFNLNLENDFNLAKKHLDNEFRLLYEKLVSFEDVVVSLDGFGNELKQYPKIWDYFVKLRLHFAGNIKDVKTFYNHIDFSEYETVTGNYIVQRYLSDDLDEPYLLDKLYSQATFSLAKWLPSSYEKIAVMGNASVWKLILSCWSYLNCIAIPNFEEPKKYTGGLLGMVDSGFHEDIVKIDFSSQYPSTFLAHCRTPDIDITNVYKLILEHALKSRLHFKDMKNKAKANKDSDMEQFYDKKQLPLKILINSFYGMLGAPEVSPFCHIESAWHITCASRQNMRHMIKYFGIPGFKIVYFHTDGANFVIPKGIKNYKYVGKGKSWLTEKGKEYEGIEAFVAEYNDKFMIGYTGVAIDEYAVSTINFSKGNFSYLKESKGKYKISHVGGGLINKKQSEYIVDFYDKSLMDLFLNKPDHFLDSYYEYIKKIYNGDLIAKKIASKMKVKKPLDDYSKGVQEGRYVRQAHMELAIRNNIQVEVGDWIYYINDSENDESSDGTNKKDVLGYYIINDEKLIPKAIKKLEKLYHESPQKLRDTILNSSIQGTFIFKSSMEKIEDAHGVLKRTKVSKESKIDEILTSDKVSFKSKVKKSKKDGDSIIIEVILENYVLNCTYVSVDMLNSKMKYNAKKYIDKFNRALQNIWIVFHPDIRDKIPSPNKKYGRDPNERGWFTDEEIQLVHGYPLEKKEDKQQDIDDLMIITEDEYEFWEMAGLSPNSPFDYQEVDVNQMYVINDSNEIKLLSSEIVSPEETILTGKELIHWLGDKVILDENNPPYRFV